MAASVRPERYHPLLAATAFLAPLLGGQLSLDPLPLAPGGVLSAILGEPQGAALAHLLVFLPLALGVLLALSRRSVLPTAHVRTTVMWAIFALVMLFGVGISSYKTTSAQTFAEWMAYLVTFFAAIALSGRSEGPRWIASGLALGSSIVATMAIKEYMVQPDPTWRVITNWSNPNALAAAMVLGAFASIAAQSTPRIGGPLGTLGSTVCVSALLLTGSKGGLLALGVGAVACGVGILAWTKSFRALALAAVGPLLGIVLAVGLVQIHPKPSQASGSVVSRVANSGSTSEQSAGFRKLLWTTSAKLIQQNPMGYGLGTFRHQSAKPGLVTQTQLAHQSYLQLGVEAGVVAMLLFLACLFQSAFEALKGSRSQPIEQGVLRAGLVGGLVAIGAHSFVDSDFSMFGLGLAFFLILGVTFQLASDATTPEFTTKGMRTVLALTTCGVLASMLYFGLLDVRLGELRYAIGARDRAAAQAAFDSASSMAPFDSRVWMLGSRVASSMMEVEDRLKRAIQLGPTPAAYRALADTLASAGDRQGARRELDASLRMDPNNLFSLRRILELEKDNPDEAVKIAERLVAVEMTPYFQVRSLPELVPTETYQARVFLANGLEGKPKIDMLLPALAGYVAYASRTVPSVAMFAKQGLDGAYGGVTVEAAMKTLDEGYAVADLLRESTPGHPPYLAARAALDKARHSLEALTLGSP